MALPQSLDIFLEPINAASPGGEPLRFAPDYDAIRDAMRSDDPDLPLGIWLTDIKQADWNKTAALCTNVLTNKSKDLQIASWLIEAWMHLYNMPGILRGFQLLQALTETFWQDAYPRVSPEGELEMRASPFIWVNDKLSKRLSWTKVTVPEQTGAKAYTFFDWVAVSRLKDLYPQADRPSSARPLEQVGGNKKPDLLDFNTNLQKTPSSFFQQMQQDILTCLETCKGLDAFLDQKFDGNGPSFFRVKNVLNDLLRFAVQTLYDRGLTKDTSLITFPAQDLVNPAKEGIESPPLTPPDDTLVRGVPITQAPSPFVAAAEAASSTDALLNSRAVAYQQIEEAVAYLAKIEPHSPVPYLMRRALSWRTKSFADVMNEMVQDPGSLADLNRLLGLKEE